MNISNYTAAFFHDGSILNIQHEGNKIELFMSSAEIDEDDLIDKIALSKDSTIRGKLIIEGVKSITISGKPFLETLKKEYDNGHIFDFEITTNSVELSIDWVNYPPKPKINEFCVIKIEAEKICWENIPDLED